MPRNSVDENFKTKLIFNINAGIYKLVMKDTDNLEIWKTFAMIQKADGSRVDQYYSCINCKKICKSTGKAAANMYRHITKCPMKSNIKDDVESTTTLPPGSKSISPEIPEETKTEIHYKLKTGVYKMVLKEANNLAIWKKYAMVSKADGSILDGYYCCIKCLKVFRIYNIYMSSFYRHVKSCAKNKTKLEPNSQQELENKIKRKIRNSLQRRTIKKTNAGINTDNEDEPIESDSYELEDGANDDELLEEEMSYRMLNPIWQTFALTLSDECKEVISCRQCKMVLDCDYSSKSRVGAHKCSSADKTNFLKVMPSQLCIEEKIKSEISNKVKAGIFKLAKNYNNKRLVWKVFDLIRTANGRVAENYACCSICKNILNTSLLKPVSLYNHNCYTQFVRERKVEVDGYNSYTMLEEETTNEIGNNVDYEDNSKKSKSSTKSDEKHSKPEMDARKLEIKANISSGVYKLLMKPNDQSVVWKIFAIITESDGTPIANYRYCTKCKQIKAYDGHKANNLARHPCVKKARLCNRATTTTALNTGEEEWETSSNDEEGENEYSIEKAKSCKEEHETFTTLTDDSTDTNSSIMPEQMNEAKSIQNVVGHYSNDAANDPTWLRFMLISRDDGSTAGGAAVSCRKCKMILKYNSTTKDQLEQHQCFPKAYIDDAKPIREKATENTVKNEIEDCYSICVKEEYNYSNSPNQSEFNLKRNSSNETLQTTENDEEYQQLVGTCSDTYSNEAREGANATYIKKEREAIEDIKTNTEDQTEDETCSENTQQTIREKLNTSEKIAVNEGDSEDWQDDDISTSSDDDERFEVKKGSSTSPSPIWEIFALILRNDGKPELSCRLCKQVLECNYKSKNYLKEHRCLKADKRNSLKIMPSQRDIEEKIKSEINNNINAGIFKLTKNKSKRSLAWQVFDLITTANGKTVADYTFCTICKKVLKCYLMKTGSLCTHKCYQQFGSLRKDEMDDNNLFAAWEEETTEENEKDVENNIKLGIYKMKHSKVTTNPIWTQFSLISKSDGTLIKEMVCCRLCKAVLKYSGQNSEDNLQQHKCLAVEESSRNRKYTTKSVEKELRTEMDNRKLEIKSNISAGVYSLFMNPDGKSVAWKIFARIIDADETLIEDYLFCTKCKQISTYDGHRTGNLTRHPCVKNSSRRKEPSARNTETANKKRPKSVNDGDSVCRNKRLRIVEEQDLTFTNESNINRSFEGKMEISSEGGNIPNNNDDLLHASANDPIWLRFELFKMDDGSTVDRVISCRQCKLILKYDDTSKKQLEQHRCHFKTSLPITIGSSNDLKVIDNTKTIKNEENNNCYSIFVKEEYDYNNSPHHSKSNSNRYSSHKPLQITSNHEEVEKLVDKLNEAPSKESIEIKKELSESHSIYIKEENNLDSISTK